MIYNVCLKPRILTREGMHAFWHTSLVAAIFAHLKENPMRIGGEPMDYEPLAVMAKRTSRAFALSPAFALVPEDLPGGLSDAERLKLLETTGRSAGDAAAATCALLQLACGGLDEAHNRVTPLSWPDGTLFGGPPIYDSEAREDATLIHCLIHVREGKYPGEFGTGVCVCVCVCVICVCDMCACKCVCVYAVYTHTSTHILHHTRTHTHVCIWRRVQQCCFLERPGWRCAPSFRAHRRGCCGSRARASTSAGGGGGRGGGGLGARGVCEEMQCCGGERGRHGILRRVAQRGILALRLLCVCM